MGLTEVVDCRFDGDAALNLSDGNSAPEIVVGLNFSLDSSVSSAATRMSLAVVVGEHEIVQDVAILDDACRRGVGSGVDVRQLCIVRTAEDGLQRRG